MDEICDICGAKTTPNNNYCNQCGVDLKEKKTTPYHPLKRKKSTRKKSEEKKVKGKEKIITWCQIVALMRLYEMTFPLFLFLTILFAEGKRDLGFCDCAVCNLGYRELKAELINREREKKVKPSSRELVILARETDIPSISFNIPHFFDEVTNPNNDTNIIKNEDFEKKNKISIEIDRGTFENVVFHILSTNEGKKLIKNFLERNK